MLIFGRGPLFAEAGEGGAGGGDGGDGGDAGDAGGESAGDAGGQGTLLNRGSQGDSAAAGEGEAGNAGDPAAGSEGEGEASGEWFLSDGVPGTGEAPDWFKADKYKSVAAQAQAAAALETRLGPAAELLGAPEDGKYAVPAPPEGVSGEFDTEDPLLQGFQKVAADMGLSQKAHDKIVQFMGGVLAEQQTQENAKLADAIATLGENADARITAVENYLTKELGAEGYAALDKAIGNDVEAYKAVEQLTARLSGDAQLSTGAGQGSPGMTREEIAAEEYKVYPEGHQLAGKRVYEHDKAHRRKVDDLWKRAFPGEDRQTVG